VKSCDSDNSFSNELTLQKINIVLFDCSSQLWVSLSTLYGQLLIVLMLTFCLTEVMDNTVKLLTLQVRKIQLAYKSDD